MAGLFALHPLHVESVAWISERKDLLSAFFFLLTLGAYAGYVKAKPSGTSESEAVKPIFSFQLPSSIFYLVALLFFACGLMSKPMLVTLPFILVLLDYWPLARLTLPRLQNSISPTRQHSTIPFLPLILEKVPFLALSLASSWITFRVQQKGGAVSTSLPLADRLINAIVSYARYLGKLFWPENLSVLYPHPGHWPAQALIGSALLLVGLSAAVIALSRQRPYLAVGWLWFAGMLIPVIGLVQVGVQSMADRYTYLPMIGLFVMLAWGLSDLMPEWRWRSIALSIAAACALAACALLTWHQLQYWRNSADLFRQLKNHYAVHINDANMWDEV